MKFLFFIALLLVLGSGCTAIPINLPKEDGAISPTAEMGGGFDSTAVNDKGISMPDAGAADMVPVPSEDASGDGMADAFPAGDDGLPTDAVGEGIVGDGEPPPEGGVVDGGAAPEDGMPEG
jgi:hypothetical protein